MPKLTYTSYIVLALVGEGGAGAHDIATNIRMGGQIYAAAAPSQVYAETKRLAALGLLDARIEPGRTTARTVYRLTDAGRQALVDWLRQPSPFPTLNQEVTLRLLAGDLLTDAEIVSSVTAMRAEIDRVAAVVAQMQANASRLPHRERYLTLQHELARRLIATYRGWVDHVEAELGPLGRGDER